MQESEAFLRAVRRYIAMTRGDTMVHKSVARSVSGLREFLEAGGGPGYLKTMGIRLVAGREFDWKDLKPRDPSVPSPVLINEACARVLRAVRNANAPVFFFQAANDYDLSPSRTLAAAMKDARRIRSINEW